MNNSFDGIEDSILVNSYGPYAHGTWEKNNKRIGNEESLKGRTDAIVENFCQTVLEIYSIKEIKELSFCDIGCYDGYLTCEIEKRLPFKKIVGYETRQKNIDKGKAVRSYLNIETNIEFLKSDIDELFFSNDTFDLVLVSGVFSHLQDLPKAVKRLSKITNEYLFIESQCYASLQPKWNPIIKLWEKFNLKTIEPKDIIYNFQKKSVSLLGAKLETNYYDGSCKDPIQVVTIPSPEYLIMACDTYGFEKTKITLDPIQFRKKIKSNLWNIRVCVLAKKVKQTNNEKYISMVNKYIYEYEKNLILTKIDNKVLENLLKNEATLISFMIKKVLKQSKFKIVQKLKDFIINFLGNDSEVRILKNIKYNPRDKIKFEYSKFLIYEGKTKKAKEILFNLVSTNNCDWRVCYRSFVLISLLYKKEKDTANYEKYKKLCKLANPNFPEEFFILNEL